MRVLRIISLLLGIFLFVVSIPLSSKIMMEKVYDWEMEKNYKIIELNEMYKGIPTNYNYGHSQIDVYHQLTNTEPYRDPWDYVINLADVYISANGETVEMLKNSPVKVEEQGLNKFTHYVSYWLVKNKRTDKESFIIILQMNGERMKELPNGDSEGFVPKEEVNYVAIKIQEDGTVAKENFSYENKTKLQTKLIPPMSYGGAGYYTDAWYSYPVFFFPFIYPFLTTIIGMVLILVSIPYLKKKST